MFDRSDEFRGKILYFWPFTPDKMQRIIQFCGSFNQQFPGQKHLLLGQFNGIWILWWKSTEFDWDSTFTFAFRRNNRRDRLDTLEQFDLRISSSFRNLVNSFLQTHGNFRPKRPEIRQKYWIRTKFQNAYGILKTVLLAH